MTDFSEYQELIDKYGKHKVAEEWAKENFRHNPEGENGGWEYEDYVVPAHLAGQECGEQRERDRQEREGSMIVKLPLEEFNAQLKHAETKGMYKERKAVVDRLRRMERMWGYTQVAFTLSQAADSIEKEDHYQP